jgi:hypothetical protein
MSRPAPKPGLLPFADSPEEGTAKLIAVKEAEDAASAAPSLRSSSRPRYSWRWITSTTALQ